MLKTMKDLKDQIEYMEEQGFDLEKTGIVVYSVIDGAFFPAAAFVEETAAINGTVDTLEIHVQSVDGGDEITTDEFAVA